MSTPRKSTSRRAPDYRITMVPAPGPRPVATPRVTRVWADSLPWWLGLLSAGLLLLATVGFSGWNGLVSHAAADYHYWKGKQAYRASEPQVVVQREWQQAIKLDPGYIRVRLDLARAYIDAEWYGGAIAEAEAVLERRHSAAEASLAYTYLGYCHYLLGDTTHGLAELGLAIDYDKQNALAQSVLERLRRQGKLPPLPPAEH